MIGRRIELFEKFSLWTEVVMFYGDAHSSYLLLTKLSKKSREMLDTAKYNNYSNIIIIFCKYAHKNMQKLDDNFSTKQLLENLYLKIK